MTVHACPSCGGSSPIGARVCSWCGVTFLSPGPDPAYSVIDPECARHGHVLEVGKEGCVICGEGASTQLEPDEASSTLFEETVIGADGKRYPASIGGPKPVRSGDRLVPRPNPGGTSRARGRVAVDGPDGIVTAIEAGHAHDHIETVMRQVMADNIRFLWWCTGAIWVFALIGGLYERGFFHG